MKSRSDPQHLSRAVSELIALRGLARQQGDEQLRIIWKELAGDKIASQTKVLGLRRGILQIGVISSVLLSELASFHKPSLLARLQEDHGHLQIRDLKFRLRGDLAQRRQGSNTENSNGEKRD